MSVNEISWKSLSNDTRATSVDGRHFLATRGAGRRTWLVMETKRCMHEHGSSESVDGAQWKGIPTANLSETIIKALTTQS